MTNEIETTKREMFRLQKEMMNDPYYDGVRNQCYRLMDTAYGKFESALEQHLEALRQERVRLVEERDTLRIRVQVLESANKIAGEHLLALTEVRKPQGRTSAQDSKENAYSEPLDAKALMIVLGALVDSQTIVCDWGISLIKAKKAMGLLRGKLGCIEVVAAQKVFEQARDAQAKKLAAELFKSANGFHCSHASFNPEYHQRCPVCAKAL